jgi:hypothetical protein
LRYLRPAVVDEHLHVQPGANIVIAFGTSATENGLGWPNATTIRIGTKAAKAVSEESGFGHCHPVPKPIEPVDFAPHAESFGFSAPFVDQIGNAFAVAGASRSSNMLA